ncbi:odorant receptor 65a [Drosophila ficusphila]|uniref:odorant receptor 65a n=1 Tax=Drosophila ficusphila TaxID=30025 RepID=UPI0007E84F68|nr:odorant receptor 65a [Drosophila ficusphila]
MTEPPSERKTGNWHRYWSVYLEGWAVFKDPDACPRHIISYWTRDQIKAMGFYTNSEECRSRRKVAWHYFIVTLLIVSLASLCFGVIESIGDIVNLGRDLVFIITIIFIFGRVVIYIQHADDFDEIIDTLEDIHHWTIRNAGSREVQHTKRLRFLFFTVVIVIWFFCLVLFMLIKISTPFWMESQTLPFHVVWPFQLHDPSKHPISHLIIFVSQVFTLSYFLVWLCGVENMTISVYFELTSCLRTLCIELRNLKNICHGDENLLERKLIRLIQFHQEIILLSDRCNNILNGAFIMQMLVNFFLVSLSLFEVLAARKDPQVAAEYLTIMIMTLGHLSYWSKFGDMFTQESEEVALAVYDAFDPTVGSKKIHRTFIFFIQRAQMPLLMSANPFPPFSMPNYMFILKQCYSIMTILANTLE